MRKRNRFVAWVLVPGLVCAIGGLGRPADAAKKKKKKVAYSGPDRREDSPMLYLASALFTYARAASEERSVRTGDIHEMEPVTPQNKQLVGLKRIRAYDRLLSNPKEGKFPQVAEYHNKVKNSVSQFAAVRAPTKGDSKQLGPRLFAQPHVHAVVKWVAKTLPTTMNEKQLLALSLVAGQRLGPVAGSDPHEVVAAYLVSQKLQATGFQAVVAQVRNGALDQFVAIKSTANGQVHPHVKKLLSKGQPLQLSSVKDPHGYQGKEPFLDAKMANHLTKAFKVLHTDLVTASKVKEATLDKCRNRLGEERRAELRLRRQRRKKGR